MILFRGETEVETGFRNDFAARGIPVTTVVRDIDGDLARIPGLIAKARAMSADLIYSWATSVSLAVVGRWQDTNPARHVMDLPVVFAMVSSPEGAGPVQTRSNNKGSGAHGRGARCNFTGAINLAPLEQQLVAMRAYRSINRLAVIYNPAELNSRQTVAELRAAASRDHFELLEHAVPLDAAGQPQPELLAQVVDAVALQKPSLVYVGHDTFLAAHRKTFTAAAVAAGLPVFPAT